MDERIALEEHRLQLPYVVHFDGLERMQAPLIGEAEGRKFSVLRLTDEDVA